MPCIHRYRNRKQLSPNTTQDVCAISLKSTKSSCLGNGLCWLEEQRAFLRLLDWSFCRVAISVRHGICKHGSWWRRSCLPSTCGFRSYWRRSRWSRFRADCSILASPYHRTTQAAHQFRPLSEPPALGGWSEVQSKRGSLGKSDCDLVPGEALTRGSAVWPGDASLVVFHCFEESCAAFKAHLFSACLTD